MDFLSSWLYFIGYGWINGWCLGQVDSLLFPWTLAPNFLPFAADGTVFPWHLNFSVINCNHVYLGNFARVCLLQGLWHFSFMLFCLIALLCNMDNHTFNSHASICMSLGTCLLLPGRFSFLFLSSLCCLGRTGEPGEGIVDLTVGHLTYVGAPHRVCQLAPLNCTDREVLNLAVWLISDWRQRWITWPRCCASGNSARLASRLSGLWLARTRLVYCVGCIKILILLLHFYFHLWLVFI